MIFRAVVTQKAAIFSMESPEFEGVFPDELPTRWPLRVSLAPKASQEGSESRTAKCEATSPAGLSRGTKFSCVLSFIT
jgi:hypothetical protein